MNYAAALFLCAAVALAGCGGGGGGEPPPSPPPPPADDARPPDDGGAAPPPDDGSDVTPPDGDPRFPGGQKESPPPTDGQGGLRGPDGQPAPRSDPGEPSPAPSGPDGNPSPPAPEPGEPEEPEPEEPRPEPGGGGDGPPAPEPSSPRPAPAEPRPAMLAPGIERIPPEALKLSNAQLASRYAVLEYRAGNDGGATRDGAGTRHGDEVRTVACASFARPCADPFDDESTPFTFHTGKQEFIENTAAQTEELLRRLSADVKLVSISIEPRKPGGVVETQGGALAFAVVQSAGNNGREQFFDPGVERLDDRFSGFLDDGAPAPEGLREAWLNIAEAVENDKVLYVAGYVETGGNFARHEESTACVGVNNGCLYAPFVLSDGDRDYRGTSFGAPHVASALASVLAMFPDTAGADLIRVAKACAIRTPSLDGLGRADFGCMTVMDDSGQWRAAASLEEALDNAGGGAPAPAAMNAMTFPGDAALRAVFEGPNGARVTLATRRPGAFRFSAGPPAPLPGGAREAGFFPIAAEGDGASSFGGGWLSESGLFAAAAYGRTGAFFGLGERFGWTGARALDAAAGHRNLFVRVSRQRARGRHVHEAEGAALGATARAHFALAPGLDASVSAHVDRFAGGFARTAFGDVEIAPSPWSREARAALHYAPLPAASVSVQAAFRRHTDGDRATEARAHVQLRF